VGELSFGKRQAMFAKVKLDDTTAIWDSTKDGKVQIKISKCKDPFIVEWITM
jgi:hypothetical protein